MCYLGHWKCNKILIKIIHRLSKAVQLVACGKHVACKGLMHGSCSAVTYPHCSNCCCSWISRLLLPSSAFASCFYPWCNPWCQGSSQCGAVRELRWGLFMLMVQQLGAEWMDRGGAAAMHMHRVSGGYSLEAH